MGDSSMKNSNIDFVSITTVKFVSGPYLVLCTIFTERNNVNISQFQNN